MITGKIDITKIKGVKLHVKDGREYLEITHAPLFKGKEGARYLDITLVDTLSNPYNDFMIVHDLGKEARQAGEKGPILGNAKEYKGREQQAPAPRPTPKTTPTTDNDDSDPIPF